MNTIAALIMGAAAAALVTALLGLAIIPWLRKLHFGQTILEIGPKWHEKKQGTPTMGGLMFIFGTIAAVAVTVITDKLLGGDIVDSSATGASIIELYTKFYSGIIFALCVALIGFADDYIKVVKKRNLGLTEKQKTCFDLYYNQDLSLSVIAEEAGITRQGVHDTLARAESVLRNMEDKTGCIARAERTQAALREICASAQALLSVPEASAQARKILSAAEKIKE